MHRIIRGFRKEFPLWKPLPPRPGSLSYSSHISVCDADSLPTARLRLFSTQQHTDHIFRTDALRSPETAGRLTSRRSSLPSHAAVPDFRASDMGAGGCG